MSQDIRLCFFFIRSKSLYTLFRSFLDKNHLKNESIKCISASKLQDTKSALDIFDFLEKRNLLTPKNADTLLECLWCMHRKDLIQKLGFEYPNRLEATILRLNTIMPFRLVYPFNAQTLFAEQKIIIS